MDLDFVNGASKAMSDGLVHMIDFMHEHGSSLTMSWDEEALIWEVAWISGGDRFTGYQADLSQACWVAMRSCLIAGARSNPKTDQTK